MLACIALRSAAPHVECQPEPTELTALYIFTKDFFIIIPVKRTQHLGNAALLLRSELAALFYLDNTKMTIIFCRNRPCEIASGTRHEFSTGDLISLPATAFQMCQQPTQKADLTPIVNRLQHRAESNWGVGR